MIDSEKVVSIFDDLRHSADTSIYPIVSPDTWSAYSNLRDAIDFAEEDILELLKEQEPQSVIFDKQCEVEPGRWERKGFCPKCHQVVLWMVNREYCGFCGQAVKWE